MKQSELNLNVTVTEPVRPERKKAARKPRRYILGKTIRQTYLDI